MPGRDFLFVVGLGRSGTTALWDVLGSHQRIVLGCERFKGLWSTSEMQDFTPDVFARERFLDLDDGLTNIGPGGHPHPRFARYYEDAAGRFDQARWVGDKVTTGRIGLLRQQFPTAHFVVIVRDVRQLAFSWQARADDGDDTGWAAHRGAPRAVATWAQAMPRVVTAAENRPDDVTVVEYDSFFGAPDDRLLTTLLARLDLEPDAAASGAYAEARAMHRQVLRHKERPLPPEHRAEADRLMASDLWRDVCDVALGAGEHLAAGAGRSRR